MSTVVDLDAIETRLKRFHSADPEGPTGTAFTLLAYARKLEGDLVQVRAENHLRKLYIEQSEHSAQAPAQPRDTERLDWLESHLFCVRLWMRHGDDGDTLRKFADRSLTRTGKGE